MADEWPRPNPQRDIYMFLGFLALCLTSAVIVAIARGASWGQERWTALAAFGTLAQAAGVLGALVYASRQIRSAHDAAVRQRIEALTDRLERVTHAELVPAIDRFCRAWHSVDHYVEFWHDPEDRSGLNPEQTRRYEAFLRDSYSKARDELGSSYQEMRKASNAALRSMRALGHGRKVVIYRVEIGTITFHGFMPTTIDDVDTDDLAKERLRVPELQKWTRDFVNWVDKWIETNAPDVDRVEIRAD
jgi:hypothetical protein